MNPANRTHPIQVKLIQAEARALGVKILSLEAADAEGIHRAFSVITRERAQALVVVADPLFGAHERRIVELAARNRLPAMHGLRQAATSGGLMSYGSNFDDLYR
jgi:putative ABC transport system substrate-binding protein